MAERITIGQLIIGHGAEQRILPPNTRFNPDDFGIDDESLAKLDKTVPPIVRRRRDFASMRPEEAAEAAVAEVQARPRAAGRTPTPQTRKTADEDDDI